MSGEQPKFANLKESQFAVWKDNNTPYTHTSKLLLCYYLGENNSMRDLRALNHVCNDRNLRLFDAQRLIVSAVVFVRACVARVRETYVCGTGACAWHLRALTYVCKTSPAHM